LGKPKNTRKMSNYFEFSAKADEWLDVTSREEILQNELNHTKNDLETRSMELLESNVTIDLLKGHKTLLENERESLRDELKRTKETLSALTKNLENLTHGKETLEQNLEALKISSELKMKKLEAALVANKQELANAESRIVQLEQMNIAMKNEHQEENTVAHSKIVHLHQLVEKLTQNISSLEVTSKKQAEQLEQAQKELQQSRSREQALRQDLVKQTSLTEQRSKELKEFQNNIGTISVLAENLKEKNNNLVRSMNVMQQQLNDTKEKYRASAQREADLHEQLVKVKSQSDERIEKQEQRIVDEQIKLKDAEDRMVGLEANMEHLKQEFLVVSEERATLIKALAEKEAMVQQLVDEKESLERELQDQAEENAADLQNAKDSLAREEALKRELKAQKAIFDNRLKEIRTILGVSAIAEIKAELDTVARLCAQNPHLRKRPLIKAPTLRVPLLISFHNKTM